MHRTSAAVVLLCAAIIGLAMGFFIHMRLSTGTGSLTSYELTLQLKRADGLDPGSDVRIGGVTVGSVRGLSLEPKTYIADVRVSLRDDLRLPVNSTVRIAPGVMSSPYLEIRPGDATAILEPGGMLALPRPNR